MCAVKAGAFQREVDPPGNWFVPPGNNRSGDRGNEAVQETRLEDDAVGVGVGDFRREVRIAAQGRIDLRRRVRKDVAEFAGGHTRVFAECQRVAIDRAVGRLLAARPNRPTAARRPR